MRVLEVEVLVRVPARQWVVDVRLGADLRVAQKLAP